MQGKTVVITGASGRLGQRLVQAFAERGATVIALVENIELAQEIPFPEEAEGWAFPADLTKEETVSAVFKRIGQQFETLDALIHTAGMWDGMPLTETSLADWHRMMEVNLTTTFLCFREAAKIMQEQESGGRLIAIASRQGLERGVAQQGAYSAAKAGVVRLVEAVAAEYADTSITVHALAPSTILYEESSGQSGIPAPEIVQKCLWLCGDAGNHLSGVVLRAYGNG